MKPGFSILAPMVRPIPAQGIALGPYGKRFPALKGRPINACRVITPARERHFPSSSIPQPSSLP